MILAGIRVFFSLQEKGVGKWRGKSKVLTL